MLNHRNNSTGILINLSWSSLQAFLEPFRVACILKINYLRNQKNRKTSSSNYESAKSGQSSKTTRRKRLDPGHYPNQRR